MSKAIYTGSFDPITNGHLDIIKRSSKMFDEIIILISNNINKKNMFTVDERKKLLEENIKDIKNIKVDSFDGLVVDYASEKNINILIRGIRAMTDYENELQMALTNKVLNKNIETIFMVSDLKYSFISSSLIKELSCFNTNLKEITPENVIIAMKEKQNI